MILSYKYKFIFIKGRKVAGTSVEYLLAQFCGNNDIITKLGRVEELKKIKNNIRLAQNFGYDRIKELDYYKWLNNNNISNLEEYDNTKRDLYQNHMPLIEILDNFGTISQDQTIFAIDRNPYYKVISMANMLLRHKQYKLSGNDMISNVDDIKSIINIIVKPNNVRPKKNITLYKDKNDNIIKNILKYENLNNELQNIFDKIQINYKVNLPFLKKGMLFNDYNNLDIFFNKEQIKIINDFYDEEFEYYNYIKY